MSIDIVIPAHNEHDRIGRTLWAYRTGIPDSDARFHVALDGCGDDTADIVRAHAGDDHRVRLHEFPKLGKGGVLMETFRRCDADLVAFVDADCATPPVELARLAAAVRGSDGAIASRRLAASFTPGRRNAGRAAASSGFAWCVRRAFRLPYADTQCGAKVLRRHAAERIVPLLSSRDFLFDVDLLVVAARLGFDIIEVPTVWIDQPGSKLSLRREAKRMLGGLLRLWVHHHTLPIDATMRPACLSRPEAVDDTPATAATRRPPATADAA